MIEYLVASSNLVCDQRVGGYDIIKKCIVLKTCEWLLAVSTRDPKCSGRKRTEESYFMSNVLTKKSRYHGYQSFVSCTFFVTESPLMIILFKILLMDTLFEEEMLRSIKFCLRSAFLSTVS